MYVYSAEKNAFYPLSMLEDYAAVGAWPDDGIDVDEAVFQAYTGQPPEETARIVERATVLGGHTTTDRRTTTRQC